jgi:hypothetical protein
VDDSFLKDTGRITGQVFNVANNKLVRQILTNDRMGFPLIVTCTSPHTALQQWLDDSCCCVRIQEIGDNVVADSSRQSLIKLISEQ